MQTLNRKPRTAAQENLIARHTAAADDAAALPGAIPTVQMLIDEKARQFTDADAPALETMFPAPVASPDAFQAPDVTTEAPADAFTPDTPEKVDWVLGKIADHRARAARIRENMELMAREADREADTLEWRFGPALQAFLRGQIVGTGRKSKRLPNGVLGFRAKPAGVSIGDTNAALAWARENLPAAVVETLDRKAISAALLETGEAVGFAAFTPGEEVFYIK